MMPRIDEVADIQSLDPYVSEWSDLVESCDHAGFLDTPEWLTTCLRHFWSGRRLAFLFVREGEALRAVLPLVEDRCKGPLRRDALALPINNQVRRSNLVTTLDPETVLGAILSHLHARHRGRLFAAHVLTDTSIARILPSLAHQSGLATTVRPYATSPFISLPGDWDEYLAGRDKRVRHELRRKRSCLEKKGRLEARCIRSEDEVQAGIEDVFRIEDNSWKATGGETMTETEELRGFYTDIAHRCANRGWLRLQLLYVDGEPIAHLLGAAYKNEFSALKTSYDERFRNLSPGIIVISEAIRNAIGEGLGVFDLLGSKARWKGELATGEREQAYYCLHPRNAVLCRACGLYYRQAKPLIKRAFPALVKSKRRERVERAA